MRFAGERVLVTGARRGIGLAFAERFAALGAHVRITSRAHDGLEPVLAGLVERGAASATAVAWDMRESTSTTSLEAMLREQPPAVVVHAAHDFPDHTLCIGLRAEDLAAHVGSYVGASHALMRAASRRMMREGRGRIAVLSSLAVELAPPGQAAYVASKLAMEGAARVLATELAPRGVGVVVVRAGIVDTENVRARVPAEAQSQYAEASGLGRLLRVDEVVDATMPFLDLGSPVPLGEIVRIGAIPGAAS